MEPTRITERQAKLPDGSFNEVEWAAVSSVEITRNAKGEAQWSVKCYGPDIARVQEQAEKTFDALAEKYGPKAD